jgi:NAD(P)-dependent dehydrogenase (short-subunit alcohol dehydrogenase family)
VTAPFLLTRALVGQMLAKGSGSIINVSSDSGVVGYPTWGAYGVSKAALDHLTRTWAAELDGTGVRINSVDPGNMDRDMHRQAEPDEDPGQWARPEDVALVFVYLASDESTGVSGRRLDAHAYAADKRIGA